jgi:membrane-bound lytic murein transglycosylase MltF
METNKVVGPDSIPIEFYQKCWEIIKHDIIEMFNNFRGELDVSRMNYGVITLLPKVAYVERIRQYRPILSYLISEEKPNASHMRAMIKLHTYENKCIIIDNIQNVT